MVIKQSGQVVFEIGQSYVENLKGSKRIHFWSVIGKMTKENEKNGQNIKG